MHSNLPDYNLLLTPKEAAKLLSVSPRKLWSMTFEDGLGVPYLKMGRLVRYPLADLKTWIQQQSEGGSHV